MKRPLKKYDVTQCALYKCRNQRRLEHLLTLQKYDLNRVKNIIAYHSFEIDKKGTDEKRAITAPGWNLKLIQSRILRLIQKVDRPDWLISGEKGKCYIDNGKAHLLADYVLTIDIKKFYDNCQREPVFRFFQNYLKTTTDIAGILTDIVTYRKGIPTGCPTSQLIAYYAYKEMFDEINAVALEYGCKFTLYVDDMTFSNTEPFLFKKLANTIDIILRKYGHRPKYRKIKYYAKKDPKPITGTIVMPSHDLEIPNNLQKKIYDNFQIIKTVSTEKDYSSEQEVLYLSLKGQLQAARNINAKKFPEINRLVGLMPAPSVDNNNKKYQNKRRSKRIEIKRNG